MLPRMFIGSSKEGIKYANYIESKLKDLVNCSKWFDDHVFIPNRGTLDVLLKQAKLSDYALLIATKDDVTTSATRVGSRNTVRDNVVFEFGLFLGATSPDRAFLFVEDGAELPSDFNGVTSLTFSENKDSYNNIDKMVDKLVQAIERNRGQSELGFVPSTTLAIGYFNGFVKNVCEALGKDKKLTHQKKEKQVNSYQVKIILPDNIDDSGVSSFATKYYQDHGLENADTVVLPGISGRPYPFQFRIDPPQDDHGKPLDVHVFDVPSTLNAILEAIKLYFPSNSIGPNEDREHLERRELSNFANTLRYLIARNVYTRSTVEVIENVQV